MKTSVIGGISWFCIVLGLAGLLMKENGHALHPIFYNQFFTSSLFIIGIMLGIIEGQRHIKFMAGLKKQ